MRLKDQIAIVTGAGQGIGREIALRLSAEGARVTLADVNEGGSRETAEIIARAGGPASLVVPTDIRLEDPVREMVRKTLDVDGRIDILVNNAGISGPIQDIEEVSLSDWEDTMAVNLRGMFLGCKYVVPEMKRRRQGSIVNIASIVGKRPLDRRTPYAASKMGVIGLTRSLAQEVGQFGIRVNALCPGGVMGPRLSRIIDGYMEQNPGKTREELIAERQKNIALRSYVDPSYVAKAVVYLCSEDAAMITGQDINVCAGTIMY